MDPLTSSPLRSQQHAHSKTSRLLSAVKRALSVRSIPLIAGIAAVLLSLPTIRLGLMWDDYVHRTMVFSAADSSHSIQNPWQPASQPTTFTTLLLRMFILTHPDINSQLRDLGLIPWWSSERVKIAQLRPLSAFTHWCDFSLWRDQAAPMHAVNILLYGMACLLAATLYRRMMTPLWVAGFAAVLYGVDDAHIIPVAWIANRNGLIAFVFGLLTLTAHDRWRRENWKHGAVLAPLCLILSIASSELGVATGAYLVAYAMFVDTGTLRRRVLALSPYITIGIVWLSLYRYLGYGAYGSGLYVDPAREPIRFLTYLVNQGPPLLLGQIALADPLPYYLISAPARPFYWLIASLFILLVGATIWPLIRKDRVAAFWSVGTLLSLILVSGINVTTARNFLFVGLGAMGLLSQFIWRVIDQDIDGVRNRLRIVAGIMCVLFVFVHAVFSPIHFGLRTLTQPPTLLDLETTLDFSSLENIQGQDLIVVNPPSTFAFLYASSLRLHEHQPLPAHIRLLSPGSTSIELTRLDSTTIQVRPSGGYLIPPGTTIGKSHNTLPLVHPAYYHQHFDQTFRSDTQPMKLHERIELSGMCVEVTSITEDGRPLQARIRFSASLESPLFKWVTWNWEQGRFVALSPPGIGETIRIPGPPPDLQTGLELFTGR